MTESWWKCVFTLREEKPTMYFVTVIISLAIVAWVEQASPQPSHPPDSDFLTVASRTQPIWNNFEIHWNSPKGDKQASQTKRKMNTSALFSVINGVYIVLGTSFCKALWILKCYRSRSLFALFLPSVTRNSDLPTKALCSVFM